MFYKEPKSEKKKKKTFFSRGGVGGARVSDFCTKNPNQKEKEVGGGGGGEGARASEFLLLRTKI